MSEDGESSDKPVADDIVEELSAIETRKIPRECEECPEEQLDDIEEDLLDDDDFGDFEEAAPAATKGHRDLEANEYEDTVDPELNVPSCSRSISCDSQTQCDISDVISDSNLWVFDELASQTETTTDDSSECVSPLMGELEVCDIFQKFDLCDDKPRDHQCLRNFQIESLRLWTLLCYVEETAALKFLWNKSFAYNLLLDALQMNVKKISVTVSQSNCLPSYSQSYFPVDASLTSSANHNWEVAAASGTFEHSPLPDASIDSLSVAPADFDWKTSGLMNPLTGASIGALSAVLECDFFNSDNPNCNGQSILERDLQDLGLSNGQNESSSTLKTPISNILPVNLNQLMQNGKPTTTTTISSPSREYKRIEELPLEAQALHDRLPDLEYMLAGHLMFPLNNHHHQQEQ